MMPLLKDLLFGIDGHFLWAVVGSFMGFILLLGLVCKAITTKIKIAQNERLHRNLLGLHHDA